MMSWGQLILVAWGGCVLWLLVYVLYRPQMLGFYHQVKGTTGMKMHDNPYMIDLGLPTNVTPEFFPVDDMRINDAALELTYVCHGMSVACGWHHDPKTGVPIDRNTGELLMLMVSELAEAMEADRKGLMDDKLPHRLGVEVELADAVIRIFDFAGKNRLDLGGAIAEKIRFNAVRPDHKPAARLAAGGKSY